MISRTILTLQEFDGNFHDVGNCDSLSSEVQEALLVILRHLQGSRLAIIASNETCSLSFSTNLENEILKRNENLPSSKKTATSRFNFSDSVVDVIKIASVLNSVKASNPKVILLATSVESQNIVLQVSCFKTLFLFNAISYRFLCKMYCPKNSFCPQSSMVTILQSFSLGAKIWHVLEDLGGLPLETLCSRCCSKNCLQFALAFRGR